MKRFVTIAMVLLMAWGAAACSKSDGDGGDPGGPIFNRPPVVSEVEWVNAFFHWLAGDAINLSITATDADGDSLTYAWEFVGTAAGTLTDPTEAATVVDITTSTGGAYRVRCTVSDGTTDVAKDMNFNVGIELSGDVNGSVTWAKGAVPYVLTDDITVNGGATLTIDPGVQIELRRKRIGPDRRNIAISVVGMLNVNGGSGTNTVQFRPNETESNTRPLHKGLRFIENGRGTVRGFLIRQGEVGVAKTGFGSLTLEDGRIMQCTIGYQGAASTLPTEPSDVTMTDVQIEDSAADGILLTLSRATLDLVSVANSGAAGINLVNTSTDPAVARATITRCDFDSNPTGNLVLRGFATVEMSCSNFLPADDPSGDDGKNVVFVAGSLPTGSLDPVQMTDCYWGLVSPTDEEDIRVQTFEGDDGLGNWIRNTDLSGFRDTAVNFFDGGEPCNQP